MLDIDEMRKNAAPEYDMLDDGKMSHRSSVDDNDRRRSSKRFKNEIMTGLE